MTQMVVTGTNIEVVLHRPLGKMRDYFEKYAAQISIICSIFTRLYSSVNKPETIPRLVCFTKLSTAMILLTIFVFAGKICHSHAFNYFYVVKYSVCQPRELG